MEFPIKALEYESKIYSGPLSIPQNDNISFVWIEIKDLVKEMGLDVDHWCIRDRRGYLYRVEA